MSGIALPPGASRRPGDADTGLELRLFGPMDVRLGGQPIPRLRSRKGLWLLALLALRGGREVERDWLAATLWPDCDEARGRHSLRQTLHDLRLALGPEASRLAADGTRTLRLELSGASVDVLEFDTGVLRGDPDSLAAAARLYRGPLLEDCAEEWSLEERRRREQAYVGALATLAAAAAARQEHAAGADYLRLAVGVDPYREDLQRALMEALAAGGSPADALLVYRGYRARLWREMAAAPAEETTRLFHQLREATRARAQAHVPAPPAAGPSRPATSGPIGNLPQPLSTFVGREAELAEVVACLASARLVTLTGTGGIGKTRLAIRVAEECGAEYADGAWFADLAAVSDPALVPQTVARALRVREDGGGSLTDRLQEALGARQLLLVLDNCEHLIDACARLANALLSRCPHLRILATSRQALGLPGEIARLVSPLSLPPLTEGSGVQVFGCSDVEGRRSGSGTPEHLNARTPDPSTLLRFEAIRLFVERAAAAAGGYALGGSNAPATVEVCRRLDGIPLALELAAARLKALSVEQICARLDDRFRLLTGGSRGALPRQQTLQATIDWSYDLLSEPERALLRRLSVFVGGFTLEAAEAVCGGSMGSMGSMGSVGSTGPAGSTSHTPHTPHTTIEDHEVLDLLTQLVDKSLVGVERRERAVRYVLAETMRDYARDRLREPEEGDERRARHAQFFLALSERAGRELRGAAQAEWLDRLEDEHDNCRAALQYLQAQGAVEEGLRMGAALGWFWWMRGYLSEGRERLQALLAQSGYQVGVSGGDRGLQTTDGGRRTVDGGRAVRRPPSTVRRPSTPQSPDLQRAQAHALSAAGILADDQSDYETARELFQASLALSRQLGDPLGAAMALNHLGGQAVQARDYPAAGALYEECLALSRQIGDQWWVAASLTNLGRVAIHLREHETARELVESALKVQRQLQDRRAIARSLSALGLIAGRVGDLDAAHALNVESLAIARELGAKVSIEEALRSLGSIAHQRGDHDAAVTFHEERLAVAREVGSAWGAAESLYYLGLLARDRGDGDAARALWSEGLTISRRIGDDQGVAGCLEGFASLAAGLGRMEPGQTGDRSSGEREPGGAPARAARAARLLGTADAWREVAAAPITPRHLPEYDRLITAARAMLDEASFAAAWAEGRAMTLDQAIAYALSETKE